MTFQTLFNKTEYINYSKYASSQKIYTSERSGCFVDNMKLPVHRWFRYSAGFSAAWVCDVLKQNGLSHSQGVVLDPFCGIGTTLFACNEEHVHSIGLEAHPFVTRLTRAKLLLCKADATEFSWFLQDFLKGVKVPKRLISDVSPLLQKCYSSENLRDLIAIREHYQAHYLNHPFSEALWLIITAILRVCSHVGTAHCQYILPKKTKASVLSPFEAFREKECQISEDMVYLRKHQVSSCASLIQTDARNPKGISANSIDFVLTSPPYPNNFDYADATRLEMSFWGEIKAWSDLHNHIRKHLLCSCSQHSTADKMSLDDLLDHSVLTPIRDELSGQCQKLAQVRLDKGGKKTYHTMAAAYFKDLGLVLRSLRPLCKTGAKLCFVLGDSAPYGVYLPVERWLGEIAKAEGFQSYHFEKIRDRNTKWKNRKHDVPLKEGCLWIQG